jgi:phosphoribosyl 1,2-cyclic phosphate phosphodiesterase
VRRSVAILGCGSSAGVPRVGGGWGTCDPNEPRNRRRRCSVLLRQEGEGGATQVLVDTSPDMREQLLDADVRSLDGIVLTHDHADHTHGIDDVRPLVIHMRQRIDAFMDEPTARGVRGRFGYIFETPEGSSYPPILKERRIEPGAVFAIDGAGGPLEIMPFRLRHGDIDALGLRVGGVAYTPDVSAIPEPALDHLSGLDVWIIDALRVMPHPSHFHLAQALEWVERMKPKRAVLTNLHNDLDYRTLERDMPAHIRPAFDGMVVEIQPAAL